MHDEPYKILAVVKFNDREALVLDKEISITYVAEGYMLFGTDEFGIFCDSQYYEYPTGQERSYGGRLMYWPMKDGTQVVNDGCWWNGREDKLAEHLGEPLVIATAKGIEELRDCYGFEGFTAVASKYKQLRASYTGDVYEYSEYEKLLKANLIPKEGEAKP